MRNVVSSRLIFLISLCCASSRLRLRVTAASLSASFCSRSGLIVSRSQPASSMIWEVFRKLGAHHLSDVAEFAEVAIDLLDRLHTGVVGDGVIVAGRFLVPVIDAAEKRRDQLYFCLCAGNRLRSENSRVRLQCTPAFCRTSAARMLSQVEGILISTRSRSMPAASYSLINACPLSIVPWVSNDRRASVSVETRPGMIFRISGRR